MADRTVTIRLRAQISEYTNALKKASGETTAFGRLAAKDFSKLGSDIERVGSDMTRKVTLPVLAAGAGALKLGSDFETAFARMVGLAGVTADEVDGLRQSILDLSGETAVAPVQLAEALYFASSAGLDTADALDAVEMAAKGSAAGLGSSADIVGLVASAIASYGAANIDAAKATDILTAAVRAGRADPAELAGTLGRVLPVAAALGVSFEEVGGTVAYLSNIFGDTNRTVTALSGFLVKLQAPSEQGRKSLEEMGTSADELQRAIDNRGLLGALDLLRSKGFAGNQQALRMLFDDIEGYQAALALLNDENGSLVGTLGAVENSAGSLDRAFGAMSETDAFKMKQAWAELQVTLIGIGGQLGPIAADFADVLSVALEFFGGLPDWAQKGAIGFLLLGAAMGPLMSNFGNLKSVADVGIRAFQRLQVQLALAKMEGLSTTQALSQMASKLGVVGILVAAGATAIYAWQKAKADARARTLEFVEALESDSRALGTNTEALIRNKIEQADLNDNLTRAGLTYDEFVAGLKAGGDESDRVVKQLMERGHLNQQEVFDLARLVNAYKAATDEVKQNTAAGISSSKASETASAASAELAKYLAGVGGAAAAATNDLAGLFDSMFGSRLVAHDISSAFSDFSDSMDGTDESAGRAGRAIDVVAKKQEAVEAATERAENANRSYEDSLRSIEDAGKNLAKAQQALQEALKGPTARDKGDADRDRRRAALGLGDAQDRVKDSAKALAEATKKGNPEEIRRATNDYKQALLAREEAQLAVTDAQAKYNEVAGWTAEKSPEVAAAQDAVTEAQQNLADATEESTRKLRDYNKAQAEVSETIAKSPSEYGSANAAIDGHKDKVLDAAGAYLTLATAIETMIKGIIASEITTAEKAAQIQQIVDEIMANPFLTAAQRAELLKFANAKRMKFVPGPTAEHDPGFVGADPSYGLAGGGIAMARTGGVRATLAEAGYNEAVIPLPAGLQPANLFSMAGGGDTYSIVVHAGMGTDPDALGEGIVTVLRRYGRINGGLELGRIWPSN